MPDIKISSQRELFEFQTSASRPNKSENQPLKIVVLADLSGRPLEDRSAPVLRRIDKDNFDSVFAGARVALNLPHHDQPLKLEEFDDLHPDFLYQKHPVFERIRELKRQLPNIRTGSDLQNELAELGIRYEATAVAPQEIPEGAGLLDSVLEQHTHAPTQRSPVQALIEGIVAPFAEAKRDPQIAEIATALDALANALMQELLHSPAFKQCEASWRSLAWLNRALDTDRQCQLYVVDVHPSELRQAGSDKQTDFTQTLLYQLLVDQPRVAGGQPFDAIVLDTPLVADAQSVQLISAMGALAGAAGAILLGDGRALVGGADWHQYLEQKSCPVLQSPLAEQWQVLRTQAAAAQTFLSAPGCLLRLPYGAKTRSCEYLPFEELAESDSTENYLWGSGAYLLCCLLVENQGQVTPAASSAWQSVIEGLPMHVRTREGETEITPPAEVYLTDRETTLLRQWGFTALRSVQHRDAIQVDAWCSLAASE